MKKTALAAVAFALVVGISSCSKKDSDSSAAPVGTDSISQRTPIDMGEGFTPTVNVRYIDLDSIFTQYHLAIDANENANRLTMDFQQAQRVREADLQKMAQQIDEKMRNNGYLSEQSYNADVQALQKKQADAQNYLMNLQAQVNNEIMEQQQQVVDSIRSFLVDYNKKYHYDAILNSTSGLYFNPSLDITAEVVAGLNARYNKINP